MTPTDTPDLPVIDASSGNPPTPAIDAPSGNPPTPEPPPEPTVEPPPEPTVEPHILFSPGQQVRHLNGDTYTVRYQNNEGVALEAVANLVHPSSLEAI